jgi:DNA-binding NarL/FixJ family response regulator
MKLRSVVADDNTAFLAKLVSVLATEFEVVATAADGKAALECIRICQPNVAVLDLEMPGFNAIEVIKQLTKYPSSPAVVICSIENDSEVVEAARQAGALGYVFKARIA